MLDNKLSTHREATVSDPSLQAFIRCTKEGWPLKEKIPSSIQLYSSIRDEVTFIKGLVLKGTRIVVPSSLCSEVL